MDGNLIEKSLFRLAGTIVLSVFCFGVFVGYLIWG